MQKKIFYTETAYLLGIVILAVGTALMEKADLGMSMVVAPAYLLYLKLSQSFPFVTFGMMEYLFQAVLLLVMMCVLRRFRISYLFSFVTAVLYGLALDLAMTGAGVLPETGLAWRIVLFAVGMLLCGLAVAMFFHTYIAPEVYELFVKEVSAKFHININYFKTGYDCISCLVGIVMSFCFFGLWHFEGVKFGTVVCALLNGFLISRFSRWMEKHFEFKDKFRDKLHGKRSEIKE